MKNFFKKLSESIQVLGRSMLLAISVMPAAAILNRLASDDLLNIPFLKEAAWTIFAIMPILFAVSVAGGIAKDKHVAAGLASVVVYYIITRTLKPIGDDGLNSFGRMGIETIENNILVGIIAGIIAGLTYEKFKNKQLPRALSFFSGRRLVIIMSSLFAILASVIMAFIFPSIDKAFQNFGILLGSLKSGPFFFGFFNRLLIPTGLHHIINSYIQMQLPSSLPEFANVTGEIPRYFAGDPTAGTFVSGMFPMMMFGLVGAALAMYRTSYPENKKRVKGLLYGAGLATFVTGITEPVEFSFMFVSPVLFVVHALLTGLSNVICNLLNIKIVGVGGSGIIDYILQFNKATNPILMLVVGVGMFFLYYFIFTFLIKKLNLKTPGREDDTVVTVDENISLSEKSKKILEYVGGSDNIDEFENCITRLRLKLKDMSKLNVPKLKELGVIEVMKMSNNNVHLVIGLEVEKVANEITSYMKTQESVDVKN